MKGQGRKAGRVNRNLKTNEVGRGETPRLKGNSSTTNVGKGTSSSAAKQDKALFKRGDSKMSKMPMQSEAKFKRGDGRLSGADSDLQMPPKFSRGD